MPTIVVISLVSQFSVSDCYDFAADLPSAGTAASRHRPRFHISRKRGRRRSLRIIMRAAVVWLDYIIRCPVVGASSLVLFHLDYLTTASSKGMVSYDILAQFQTTLYM
ncbi:hypothetical protein B0J13DRAFT_202333 [Dactylonectria estremocensis]|uniref:Uncharacterized protein n=1 Tax=Dactylonectria estremocensis TaxID=1079267 RepID=A0A9P9DFG0_9HYPO|nr:hypothetical protein B0J13DRAFT_202333 [Dactylonectria estremocensis]